ncbi:acyl-coa dehydrogenase-like protein [Dermatophagoides farinae]|uniref:Acyl-coa dehydrogenase-like protein n=1 Tax=Dermatophagoides farinae TaxID=6954 RepID=A0A9D4NYD7_DERFA|nr:acyl-coa dehydrogenase-like protein [Dermatophagoides farinae]
MLINTVVKSRLNFLKYCRRCLSSSNQSIPQPKSDSDGKSKQDETTTYYTMGDTLVEPIPIKSLNILSRIETYEKYGSSFKNLFLGVPDTDLLSFPFLLKSRKEFLELTEQYEMVRTTWNKIKKDEQTLNLLNYNSLYKLSVSEMMFIFEAIGASVEKNLPFGTKEDEENRFEKRLSKTFNIDPTSKNRFNIGEAAFSSFHNLREAIETVVPLIERNAIVYYALSRSSNDHMKSILANNTNIAFAFDEDFDSDRTDIKIDSWSSQARLANDFNSWVITGRKNNIINGNYSHYLIFTKTNDYTEVQGLDKLQNDVGIIALLAPANQVKVELDAQDFLAIQHQRISFEDLELFRDSSEVINATKNLAEFNNVKGCGQLAVSAFILGLLKQLQKNTYAYLVNNRLGLTDCEFVQYKLFASTCKIYGLESMIYLTAAMYDSFERGANLGGESITIKTKAVEYAYDVIGELRSLFGSRYPFSSTVYDLIYYLDSFLDCSMNNRMLMANEAVKHYKTFEDMTLNRFNFIPKEPINTIRHYLKQRKLRRYETYLTREMTKYVHHNLHAACDWIEHLINLLQFSMHYLSTIHQEKFQQQQFDLNRLVEMAMDIEMMISCLSRANHAICYGIRNGHSERDICMAICKELFLKHLQTFEAIDKRTLIDNNDYCRRIFETNMNERGYFPKLFQVE